ncbi:MAG: ParB/RepB/Spo0J family partition protein [Gammaproteobacteria bacterium]|nr:ParB/RepB/Spo0J family partition protein [Gammaproteobacteria bacterium]MDH5344544.1 ParB/RepB/Spo0J family partition protein [Gammaproteobacteria bacterium]
MTKKKRLGRGLDALLSKPVAESAAVTGARQDADEGLRNLPVELLQRGQYQPRVDMRQDTLEGLAASIRAQGVVQPIVVRPVQKGHTGVQHYEIVAGERRWRAAQMAGLAEIPAIIREIPDDAAIAMSLIENIQRENLNPIEEAHALERLIGEFDLTHQEAAEAVGRSRAAVSNLLRLLELSDKVRPMLESREIDMGHARALLSINDKSRQFDIARDVVKHGLSVRATEQLIRRELSGSAGKKKVLPAKSKDIQRLEMDLSDRLGARVTIDHSQKGSGKLVIGYNSLDELDGILKHIK